MRLTHHKKKPIATRNLAVFVPISGSFVQKSRSFRLEKARLEEIRLQIHLYLMQLLCVCVRVCWEQSTALHLIDLCFVISSSPA